VSAGLIADRFVALKHEARRVMGVFVGGQDASAADTPSTTNTATYVDATVWTWNEIPDGLYVVRVSGSLMMAHSAGGDVDLRIVCQGTPGSGLGPSVPAASPATTRVTTGGTFVDVEASGGTGLVIELEYKGGDAGTTSARNPQLNATAIKVG
jgi:hypothetical protein